MDSDIDFFFSVVYKQVKNTLSCNADYCRLTERNQTALETFCKTYSNETVSDALCLIDDIYNLADAEALSILKLGFRLGYALGQTDES